MQTFLPYNDYAKSAAALDNKRLNKQRSEVKQIYKSLVLIAAGVTPHGWMRHPAVLMWLGHEAELLKYGIAVCTEWTNRGYKDNLLPEFKSSLAECINYSAPKWLGNKDFHLSHQSNLIRKDSSFYSPLFPGVPDNLPYYWPSKHDNK